MEQSKPILQPQQRRVRGVEQRRKISERKSEKEVKGSRERNKERGKEAREEFLKGGRKTRAVYVGVEEGKADKSSIKLGLIGPQYQINESYESCCV